MVARFLVALIAVASTPIVLASQVTGGQGSQNIGINNGVAISVHVDRVLKRTARALGTPAWNQILQPGNANAPSFACPPIPKDGPMAAAIAAMPPPSLPPLSIYTAGGKFDCTGERCNILDILDQGSNEVTPLLWIDRHGDAVLISAKVFAEDGRLAADLNENHPYVNDALVQFKERKNVSSLELLDSYGLELLKVDFLNKRAIELSGTFRAPHKSGRSAPPIRLTKDEFTYGGMSNSGNCGEGLATAFRVIWQSK